MTNTAASKRVPEPVWKLEIYWDRGVTYFEMWGGYGFWLKKCELSQHMASSIVYGVNQKYGNFFFQLECDFSRFFFFPLNLFEFPYF